MIIDYTIEEGYTAIHVFRKGKHHIERFVPYFFEPDQGGSHKSIFGKSMRKVEVIHPSDVPKQRTTRSHEADVLFDHRFMLDRLKYIDTEYSFLCLDIENSVDNMPTKREEVANGHSPIFSIAYLFECPWRPGVTSGVFYLCPPGKTVKFSRSDVTVFQDEAVMLEAFAKLVRDLDPDIITGWNCDSYDLPYLINRMLKLNVYPCIGRLGKMAKVRNKSRGDDNWRGQEVVIWGRSVMDAMAMYISKRPKQNHSWRLEYISAKEGLTYQKKSLPGKGPDKFETAWRETPDIFVDYNFYDVLAATELFKLDFPLFKLIQTVAFCPIEKTIGQNSVTGSLFLRLAGEGTRRVLPSGGKHTSEKIPGGKVLDPLPGYWENVEVMDFASYYPNIVKTFNLSPETYLPGGGGCQMFNGCSFDQSKRGILPEALDYILPERFKYKALANGHKGTPLGKEYDTRQKALKYLADGMYGATKNGYFRLHSIPVARTVTETGREGLTFATEFLSDVGCRIIGGDTDSVFVVESKTDPCKMAESFDFGEYLPRICWGDMPREISIELKHDIHYDCFFQTYEKKHYFAMSGDELISKGYDKSDLPMFSGNFQKEVFREILELKGEFPDGLLFQQKNNFMAENLEIIGFPGRFPGRDELKKAVAYAERELGLKFTVFDRPLMFKLSSTGTHSYSPWVAVNYVDELPSSFVVDREGMWTKMVSMTLGNTVKSMVNEVAKIW